MKPDMMRAVARRLVQVAIQFLVTFLPLLVLSGQFGWVWAWVYFGLYVAIVTVNMFVLPVELIAERGRARENVKNWDKTITTISIVLTLGLFVVAGLDQRLGWSPELPLWLHLMGLAVMSMGQGLFSWAMASNKFFSTRVRIQIDRGHIVATGGPYRYVRHPGYVGYIATTLAIPLLLGSLWGLIPAAVTACLFVVRTALEDRTLQEELDGYKDYAQHVPYRLLPRVW